LGLGLRAAKLRVEGEGHAHLGEGALAAAVLAHDGVRLALLDGERDAVQNLGGGAGFRAQNYGPFGSDGSGYRV